MKLARVTVPGRLSAQTAVVLGGANDRVAILPERLGDLDDLVRRGIDTLAPITEVLPRCEVLPAAEVAFTAPLRRFNRDVLCVGWNFDDHFYESEGRRLGQDPVVRPGHPTFFTKAPDAMIGPFDEIGYDPELSQQWDFEAEIALIVGRTGRSIPEADAPEYIFGLCVANDVSLRDVQRAHGGQWMKGKSTDGTTPLGPWITTWDELDDVAQLRIQCEVNGTLMQDATAATMAFPFATLITELSRGMTIRAGDVLLTGTPSGIGNARNPPVFLRDGDELVTRVDGLGELRNAIRQKRLT